MSARYPGYDVLAKRNSPSWNDQTRSVIDARLSMDPERHVFFNDQEWSTLKAVCARIAPQPADRRPEAPVAALVDEKMEADAGDGYRSSELPPMREAWRRGLAALDAECWLQRGAPFAMLGGQAQDEVLKLVQQGDVRSPLWKDLPPGPFFATRILHDIVSAYYALPCAWDEVGFGGPAGPRGYVRMNYDRRDPWEASEAKAGREEMARRENARIG